MISTKTKNQAGGNRQMWSFVIATSSVLLLLGLVLVLVVFDDGELDYDDDITKEVEKYIDECESNW